MGKFRGRIDRLKRDAETRRSSGPHVVILDPIPGRPPGLHRAGPPGSMVAVWSGDPALLSGRVPPYALIVGGDVDPDAI